jgi:hypothetical protein
MSVVGPEGAVPAPGGRFAARSWSSCSFNASSCAWMASIFAATSDGAALEATLGEAVGAGCACAATATAVVETRKANAKPSSFFIEKPFRSSSTHGAGCWQTSGKRL